MFAAVVSNNPAAVICNNPRHVVLAHGETSDARPAGAGTIVEPPRSEIGRRIVDA